MSDYEHDETSCPECGHAPTHWRDCGSMCDEGYFDEHDDDPINYTPGEMMTPCSRCHGTEIEHWCPKCGLDIQAKLVKEREQRAQSKHSAEAAADATEDFNKVLEELNTAADAAKEI